MATNSSTITVPILHYTYIALQYTTVHNRLYSTQHNITQHNAGQDMTTLKYTTLHYIPITHTYCITQPAKLHYFALPITLHGIDIWRQVLH